MAGPFLVTNLFHTLPLHPGPKGSGRSLALLRSLAHIHLDMVPERHLTRMVSPVATGLSIRSTKRNIGNVSEAMQNLIMQHADIRTFLRHYLSRRITADTQAIIRGLQPQDALMRAACTMSRSIDPQ